MKDNIEYRKGNLLDVTKGIILHGCNSKGVMGSGVALAIKNKYPEAYQEYLKAERRIGSCTQIWVTDDLLVINGITQFSYGREGRYVNYDALCKVFEEALTESQYHNCSLNFPKIGAGLGGGDWDIIQQLINDCDPSNQVRKICWELK